MIQHYINGQVKPPPSEPRCKSADEYHKLHQEFAESDEPKRGKAFKGDPGCGQRLKQLITELTDIHDFIIDTLHAFLRNGNYIRDRVIEDAEA